MKEYGLVLSSSGTKGAFEIGAWQALREMNIHTPCVIGTSVGVLNAAIIAQNNFDKALDFWSNITINQILNLNTHMANKYIDQWSKTSFDFFRLSFLNDLFHGGLDIASLRETLDQLISEEEIRKSPIRLGLVTVRLNTLSPVTLMIEDIPQGKLLDYLLASIAFPVFQKQEIDGITYLDGGFHETVPIDFMTNNGYKDILAVEFPVLGVKQKQKNNDVHLHLINNSEYLGMTLEFDQNTILHNIKLGYLDCLKSFKAVQGKSYYFNMHKQHHLYDQLADFLGTPLEEPISKKKVAHLLDLPIDSNKTALSTAIHKLAQKTNYPENEPLLMKLLEITGKSLGVKKRECYTMNQFFPALLNALNALTKENLSIIKKEETVKEAFKDATFDYSPSTRLDFITFYVLFVGARSDMPFARLNALLKKLTPEFTLSILLLIYIHQMIQNKA